MSVRLVSSSTAFLKVRGTRFSESAAPARICSPEILRDPWFVLTRPEAISNRIGPLLGGSLTQDLRFKWPWFFWINLPLGSFVVLAILLCLDTSAGREIQAPKGTILERIDYLDLWGTALLLVGLICVLLAVKPISGTKSSECTSVVVAGLIADIFGMALAMQQLHRKAELLIPRKIIDHCIVLTTSGLLLFLFCWNDESHLLFTQCSTGMFCPLIQRPSFYWFRKLVK